MEGTKPRTASTIGMFDLLKGVGMLMIVFAHTAELYPLGLFGSGGLSVSGFGLFIYREALMAAFYIASGYGFRQRSVGKCIQQQCKLILKPYFFTAVCTTALHFVIHYKTFGYMPGTLEENSKVLGGFLLGLPHTAEYAGKVYFSSGPMWYLLALMMGWILLDILFNAFPERYLPFAVTATAVLGWGTCLVWELPFSISQGMVIVPYLYIGHLIKKTRLLERPIPKWLVGVILASTLAVALGAWAAGSTDCISLGEWTLGPLSIFLDGAVGCGLVLVFLRWNRGRGPIVTGLEAVGRRSLQIFCVHTVELTAIPWYLFAQQFEGRPLQGLLAQYILSVASIWLICEVLLRGRALWLRVFPSRRKQLAPARRYVSRH